ncbi:hypothetical protein SLS62_010382 [Diatrype stigma]|uniref:sn-1-specific diacylglycerol lipase n=1 Tax=Diatrype stigma TaxID=117547 RepID=A0AAN9YHC2_9PEZI
MEGHDSDEADPLTGPASHLQKAVQKQDGKAITSGLISASPVRTLLPSPVANAVSFATRSTSFALRISTTISGYGLSAAKFTTLSSLELGRGVLEGILHRAGKDVISGSRSDLGRADAETVLERSLESLHQTMNRIMFWTTTGFHVTGTAVSTASQISQLFLSVLDQFFGSTDSSRAIASIITLIRREFQNPATGVQGEKVGVMDLVLGICGLAYLQSWCRKMIQDESRTLGDESDEVPERLLKEQVMESLPREATVSITTSTTVTKTITVEVKGTPSMPLVAPPGLDLVETPKLPEKKGGFRSALKKGSSNLLHRDSGSDNLASSSKSKLPTKPPPRTSSKASQGRSAVSQTRGSLAPRDSRSVTPGDVPRPPQRGNPNYFSSKDLGDQNSLAGRHKDAVRSGYISLQDRRRRNSVVSLTDTFSVQSYESRAPSPAYFRAEPTAHGSASHLRAGSLHADHGNHSTGHGHSRNRSSHLYTPSIYTLNTAASQSSLVLSSANPRSAYSDSEAVDALRRTGSVRGLFPDFPLLRNITRYSKYASAAYGWNFLKFMGIRKEMPALHPGLGAGDDKATQTQTHRDVRSFAHHTGLPPSSIILSSFVDPQGGSDSTGATETGVPLVHTIALDAASRAVVLACRGTLGFEDVLVDMMCDYDDLAWRGRAYRVHKGIHASARRLLYGGDGRVLATLREALEEFPDYGLVLCGHSLGGAVTALLGVMLAEPASASTSGGGAGTAFVTTSDHSQHGRRLLMSGDEQKYGSGGGGSTSSAPPPYHHICLPAGRPIHVYAYGPPATMSPALQRATRGLVTSTVHGNDLVPYLSLGVLHDLQALALAFKSDNSEAKAEVRRRIWEGLQSGLVDRWYSNKSNKDGRKRDDPPGGGGSAGDVGVDKEDATTAERDEGESGDADIVVGEEEDHSGGGEAEMEDEDGDGDEDPEVLWAWAALKTLRASMMSDKLLPPGEVFAVETTPVLRRDAFRLKKNSSNNRGSEPEAEGHSSRGHVGRPATRVVLRYVRDVEARFREVRFGASMLLDHSPGRYEDALRRLMAGVGGDSSSS